MSILPCSLKLASALTLAVLIPQLALKAQTPDQAAIVKQLHAGSDAIHRGDPAAAEAIFQHVVTVAPTLSDGYLGLGLAEMREGKLEQASGALIHATELNPHLPGAHLFLGIVQYQIGQPEAAAISLRAELSLKPEDVEALTWLGIVEIGAGHPEDATAPLDRAAALQPKDPNILYYVGKAHSLVAESFYKQLYALDPDSALVHRALGESLSASDQPEKAIAEYEAAIRKQPGNADLYEALGDANQKMARFEAAANAYEEELKFNPNSAIALYNLGKIEVEHGKPESGVAHLQRAEAAHSLAAPTDFYLGLGLAELGKNHEAATWFEQSLANHPSPFIAQSAYYQVSRVYQKLDRKADAQRALAQLQKLKSEAAKNITQAEQPSPQATPPPSVSGQP